MFYLCASPLYALTETQKSELAAISDEKFNSGFQCPESIGSHGDKVRAVEYFMDWVGARHPDWTLDHVLNFRYLLLVRHDCMVTLQNIQNDKENH